MLRRSQDRRCNHVRVFSISERAILTYHDVTSGHSILSAVNPAFSAEELQYQLESANAKFLFVHPTVLQTGLAAARTVGLPNDRIVLIDPTPNTEQPFVTLDEVIQEGLQHPEPFVERQLKPAEAKTKIAVSATVPLC